MMSIYPPLVRNIIVVHNWISQAVLIDLLLICGGGWDFLHHLNNASYV